MNEQHGDTDRFTSIRVVSETPISKDDVTELPLGFQVPRFVGADRARFDLEYHELTERNGIVAYAILGRDCQGPPGHAHGGAIATLLDEAMGFAAWYAGHPVVAARLNVGFRKPLPLERPCRIEGWIEKVSGHKISTRGRACLLDGTVYSDADGLFVELGHERFAALAKDAAKQSG